MALVRSIILMGISMRKPPTKFGLEVRTWRIDASLLGEICSLTGVYGRGDGFRLGFTRGNEIN